MNFIIPIHVAQTDRPDALILALRRLSLYLDTETDLLAQILEVATRHRPNRALEALLSLHLEPDSCDREIRQLLETARDVVYELLDGVRSIPVDSQNSAPGVEDFDARARWAGARLQDMLATLNWSLD